MRSTTHRVAAAVATAGLAAAALVATYVVAVHTAAGQSLDTALMVRLGANVVASSWSDLPEGVLGLVSPVTVLLGTVVVGLLGLVVGGFRHAVAGAATVVGTVVGAQVLKVLLVRPDLVEASSAYGSNSLPSGHTAAVAGLAAGLVVALGWHARPWAWAVAGSVSWLAGLATIALQWHRPSDVLASTLLAVGVAATSWVAAGLAAPRRGAYARAA